MEEVCSSSTMADAPSTAMLTSESPGRVYLGRFSFPFGQTIYGRIAGLAARVVRPAQRLSRDRDSDSESSSSSSSRRNTRSISKPSLLPYVHFSHPHRPFPKSPSIYLLHGKRYHPVISYLRTYPTVCTNTHPCHPLLPKETIPLFPFLSPKQTPPGVETPADSRGKNRDHAFACPAEIDCCWV